VPAPADAQKAGKYHDNDLSRGTFWISKRVWEVALTLVAVFLLVAAKGRSSVRLVGGAENGGNGGRSILGCTRTAAAIRYALSRWPALTRYAGDGQLEIDNNAAERALRVVALGRKNFLFAGSNAGGERAAAI
jgi:hypothetical protein